MSSVPSSRPSPLAELWTLIDHALPEVHGYLVVRCGDPTTAQDLVMTTVEAAIQRLQAGPVDAVTTAWLIGIARHKLVDHWRRTDAERRRQDRLEAETELTDDPWDVTLDRQRAHDVLATLGTANRAALTLRYLDGLYVADVARILGRSVQATEALLTRARRAFRTEYERTEDDR